MQITSDRVRRALAQLDRTQRYIHADTAEAVYLYQLIAAQRHGVFEPFDAEARELNAWLDRVRAGKALVEDAWDAFMREGTAERGPAMRRQHRRGS